MSAPFVGAYSWILLLGRNGVITKFLTNAFHLPAIDIYGFKGIVLVFTLQLFPLVFLYVAGTMKSIDNSLLEAAESMGSFGFKRIRNGCFASPSSNLTSCCLACIYESILRLWNAYVDW